MKCSKCGSDKIMTDVKIVDHGQMNTKQHLTIEFYTNPSARVFKAPQSSALFANICGQCGYVEMSVSNPEELWNLYTKNRTA